MNQEEAENAKEQTADVVELKTEENAAPKEEAAVEEAQPTLEDMQAENDKMKEQVLRAMAESENTRRRLSKELDDARKYSVSKFAKEMLTVSDNFRRALDAVPEEKKAQDEALKTLMDGIEATERQLEAILERFGIKKMESPLEKPFDPHVHQVMMEQEDPNKPAGMVLQVLQAGYMIHDRLLREAMVVVAKGGPAAVKIDTEV